MYQRIVLVGYVGSKPEMRYTSNGTPVTSFSLATNRRWTDAQGQQGEETVWWRITAWRKLAETCNEYLDKGRLVLVEGRVGGDRLPKGPGSTQIVPHTWIGQDGEPRAQYEITAAVVRFLGRADAVPPADMPAGAPEELPKEDEEEIPF
jgi:single-strand DNA-binding protein